MRLRASIVQGAICAPDATERLTEEGGESTQIILDAGQTLTTARARGNAGLPSSSYVALWMSFTIWDWCSFRQEEEDEEDDSNGSRKRDNNKGTMMTTNNCSGRGRRNAKG